MVTYVVTCYWHLDLNENLSFVIHIHMFFLFFIYSWLTKFLFKTHSIKDNLQLIKLYNIIYWYNILILINNSIHFIIISLIIYDQNFVAISRSFVYSKLKLYRMIKKINCKPISNVIQRKSASLFPVEKKKPNQLPLICNIFSYPLNTCFTTYYFSRVNHLSYVKEEGTWKSCSRQKHKKRQ